jgi:adenosylhomocysteine nucleosidase
MAIRIGIISALQEEQHGLVEAMQGTATLSHGMRDYTTGTLWGVDAVCVLSRIGKVAAAMTATILIERFGVTHIVFTGVAGAGDASIRVGDIVIAEHLVQYDMDASPLFPVHQVPLTGISHFQVDLQLSNQLSDAAHQFIANELETALDQVDREAFGLDKVRIHRGLIGTGDRFVSCKSQLAQIAASLPGLLAVEMEGAAVAQVCKEMEIPFAVIRTVSDNANEEAATDFMRFVSKVASKYTYAIIEGWIRKNPSLDPSSQH